VSQPRIEWQGGVDRTASLAQSLGAPKRSALQLCGRRPALAVTVRDCDLVGCRGFCLKGGDGVKSVLDFIGHELTRRGPLSPALLKHETDRANSLQSRVADVITGFAGSMTFVYVHLAWFAFWIMLPVEKYPYGLLTMIVSLEAIFLSTFVMISQNRADSRRQVFADNQYEMIQEEKKQNLELIEQGKKIEQLTQSVLALTKDVHAAIGKR
jgi:uncharacterized membrane protein